MKILLLILCVAFSATAQELKYERTELFYKQFGSEVTEIETVKIDTVINPTYSGPVIIKAVPEKPVNHLKNILLLTDDYDDLIWIYDSKDDNFNLNIIYRDGTRRLPKRSVQNSPVWIW